MKGSSLPPAYALHTAQNRDIKKVPFVELHDQRLQGVVSSGSDIERVYVSFVQAGSLDYSCMTNNNRPCGGLRGSPCNHIQLLVEAALQQYGVQQVAAFLRLPGDPNQWQTAHAILRQSGQPIPSMASDIFSRFLEDLHHLMLEVDRRPLHSMAWFIQAG
jgi:hypothetical protein